MRAERAVGHEYGAIVRLWNNAWEEFIPVPRLRRRDPEGDLLDERDRILERSYRRAIKARGHFPTEQAALKCLYLVTRSLDPTGAGRARWTMRWKPAVWLPKQQRVP